MRLLEAQKKLPHRLSLLLRAFIVRLSPELKQKKTLLPVKTKSHNKRIAQRTRQFRHYVDIIQRESSYSCESKIYEEKV